MSKVWFVTGSSRGLGRSIVEFAVKNGDLVVATARNPDSLGQFAETYGPSKVLPLALDVTDWEAANRAVEAAINKFGRIDVVVNNAGYANIASLEDVSIDDFRRQVDTNLMGVVWVSKAVVPILRKQGSGHIFNISSVGGRVASPGLIPYQCSKWAVGGFTAGLNAEVRPHGVKVTALEPGAMRTDWAGPSMTVHPISEPYQETVSKFANYLRSSLGSEVTDPEKVAPIIETLYNSPEPPVRMLIGPDAVPYAAQAAELQAKSDEQWKELSISSA